MLSEAQVIIIVITVIVILGFLIGSVRQKNLQLIHKLFFCVSGSLTIWLVCVLGLHITGAQNLKYAFYWDCVMYLGGGFLPVFSLLIALTFTRGLQKLPKSYYALLIIPVLTEVLAWTNPYHHLLYRHFSIYSAEVVFGPYMYVSLANSFICATLSIIIMINFALHSKNKLFVKQAILFSTGSLIPGLVNLLATLRVANLSVAATPLASIMIVLFDGLAIYYFHMLDIRPIAMQRVLDWITDCYLVTNGSGLVVDFNKSFYDVFGRQYNIEENTYLAKYIKKEDVENKTGIYNLITAIAACRQEKAVISYEQAVFLEKVGKLQKYYYMVDVTPLFLNDTAEGYVAIFKDVTKVKESMQKLQDSQTRLMEQERLVSLGQMVGGLAHNLKTPIMSISGSTSAMDNLIDECRLSLGDPDVIEEDYREIYGEMKDWLLKIREACAYMSDIISAVKGQATNANTSDGGVFTMSELIKRVSLLLRHELVGGNSHLIVENQADEEIFIHGDINNLVQVVNNLVTNAIDAQKSKGGGNILISLELVEGFLLIKVKDQGPGVPPDIKERLFKQMITSKGALGTGLGLYISNAVVRAKFGGGMWVEDNPQGGAVFGIRIPMEYVTISPKADRGQYQ
ncbi:MAG: histidine kinase N-terminal 7TM domain-containing protein [Peptococcaceae bacterium]|nr:histidine kinase N-terminal 7TM domain-containing protein [Peptococcaceae bacterium]